MGQLIWGMVFFLLPLRHYYNIIMRAYKVIEVIKLLEADGWILVATKGDHRQYKHPQKKGKVTIRGHKNEVLSQFLLNSIWKQAGWK